MSEERHASEYSHYEGALVRTLGIPLLLLAEEGLLRRGIYNTSVGFIIEFPRGAGQPWLESPDFSVPFEHWLTKLRDRRDVFLGYSNAASETADKIKSYMTHELGATVLDWKPDFDYSDFILKEFELAAERCTGGVFLFTRDDALVGKGKRAAPRDNVVFEAGYFSALKGKSRVLIVLETRAKMPTDLGGDIYASLTDRPNIESVKEPIQRFIRRRIGG
jgi:hypothetical protein